MLGREKEQGIRNVPDETKKGRLGAACGGPLQGRRQKVKAYAKAEFVLCPCTRHSLKTVIFGERGGCMAKHNTSVSREDWVPLATLCVQPLLIMRGYNLRPPLPCA